MTGSDHVGRNPEVNSTHAGTSTWTVHGIYDE